MEDDPANSEIAPERFQSQVTVNAKYIGVGVERGRT